MTEKIKRFRSLLQYLWFRSVPPRRIIDYIGAIEASEQYGYIRKNCEDSYEQRCASIPALLKDSGFDMIFRNLIIAPFFYHRIYDIFKHRKDPVMARRVDRTMDFSLTDLMGKVVRSWAAKFWRDRKIRIQKFLRRVKWNNNGVRVEKIRACVREADFDCVVLSNKFLKVLSPIHPQVFQGLCRQGLKPLFIVISDRYHLEKKDSGFILEIPFQAAVFPRFSPADRRLLKAALRWVSGWSIPRLVRGKVKKQIADNFLEYTYCRDIALEIFKAGKAQCLLTFAENEIEFRVFLQQAQSHGVPAVFLHCIDGVQPLTYKKYFSDHVIVPNRIQYQHFVTEGFPPERVHVVGSFNFFSLQDAGITTDHQGPRNILYFTKGVRHIDEAVLDELLQALDRAKIRFRLVIKKHPKDINLFTRFQCASVEVTSRTDYRPLIEASDLVVSQYSGVIREIIPLRKPLVLYTYSDILEYGERGFFSRASLPNYLKYAQNAEEFQRAVEDLLKLRDPEPLPQKLAENLYGYLDRDCTSRIAGFIHSLVCGHQKLPGLNA